jgi:hypothetical protein
VTVKRVPALKARQQLGALFDEVRYQGAAVIGERDGRPVAVEAYERYRRLRGQAVERIAALRDRLAIQTDARALETLISAEARN